LNLKTWDWLIFLAFGCLTFLHLRGLDAVSESKAVAPIDDRKLLLFILDFQDFSCMTCLDSLLALYRILPFRFKTSQAWGVLVVDVGKAETETEAEVEAVENRLIRIAEKKLRGFVQANHITFPILVDRFRIFGRLSENGSCVLLFDETKSILNRYEFPLTGEQLEEIFLLLTE
jgi:hypothetical protein